jgi:hypothetical protein
MFSKVKMKLRTIELYFVKVLRGLVFIFPSCTDIMVATIYLTIAVC